MPSYPALVCRNCGRPNPLPSPTHPGTIPHQSSWPKDEGPRNFLCPGCKHVFAYSGTDVQMTKFRGTDPRQAHKGRSVFYIEMRCGTEGCALPVRIHMVAPASAGMSTLLPALRIATAHNAVCMEGHPLNGKLDLGGSVQAFVDSDWFGFGE